MARLGGATTWAVPLFFFGTLLEPRLPVHAIVIAGESAKPSVTESLHGPLPRGNH